jgi:serine/threonine-protein kinase
MVTRRASVADWTGQTLFGKWSVERLIGVGGTATVLQARHRNGRRAALKILHLHLAAQGRTRERFLREGRLANLVNHPGVVAVLDDFVTDDGTAVLVLELVEGKTLATLARDSTGVLSPREVVDAACAVLEILAVAHDANVVHRDVKPENILRCPNGTHKLADFGLAALCHELGMLTGTNATLGTPAYMSPEQARGDTRDVDARADIWAVGATMFTLLTGRFLHADSGPKNLVVAAATEQARPVSSLEPLLHQSLADVIDRAVRMDKKERWPNARAMLEALRAIDIPASEANVPLRRPASPDGATLSTAQTSAMSWSRAQAWLTHGNPGLMRRSIAASIGIVAAGIALFVLWPTATPESAPSTVPPNGLAQRELSPKPSPSEIQTVSAPSEASNAPTARVLLPALPHETRSRDARHAAAATKAPVASPSSAPSVSRNKSESEALIPDEILDRRE